MRIYQTEKKEIVKIPWATRQAQGGDIVALITITADLPTPPLAFALVGQHRSAPLAEPAKKEKKEKKNNAPTGD